MKVFDSLPFLKKRSRFGRAGAMARRIGPKRAGIGGAGILAALAIPFIVRAVRARRAEQAFRPAVG